MHFRCPECGPHVAADEDGCCAACGTDCVGEPCGGHVCGTGRVEPIDYPGVVERWRAVSISHRRLIGALLLDIRAHHWNDQPPFDAAIALLEAVGERDRTAEDDAVQSSLGPQRAQSSVSGRAAMLDLTGIKFKLDRGALLTHEEGRDLVEEAQLWNWVSAWLALRLAVAGSNRVPGEWIEIARHEYRVRETT